MDFKTQPMGNQKLLGGMPNGANPSSLSQFYDDLKNKHEEHHHHHGPMRPANPRMFIVKQRDKLKDGCFKHILLDIYCNILPLDKDYIDGHMGQMNGDIDAMLKSKGMTPSQYLTSCYESTKAPLLEFIIRSVNNIGKQYMEEAEAEVKDNEEKGIDAPIPEAPDDPTEIGDVEDQLVDIEKDTEYEDFMAKLKEKAVKKIVKDVSDLINGKKEDKDMSFDPKPAAEIKAETESTTSIGMSYLQSKLFKEHVDTSGMTEELLGIAIRESTLNQFDVVFKQPGAEFRDFEKNLKYNHGALINESTISMIVESAKSADEVANVVDKAKKEFDDSVNSKLKASDVLGAQGNKDKDKNKNVNEAALDSSIMNSINSKVSRIDDKLSSINDGIKSINDEIKDKNKDSKKSPLN